MISAQEIVLKGMMENDAFSRWMDVQVLSIDVGYCLCKMTVRSDMVNGFGVCHGGVSFAFADSAFAFASNSRGMHAVSIETSISHTKAVQIGDTLTAEARELHRSNKLGTYAVDVKNQNNEIVALFKGTVFIKNIQWEI